MTRIFDWFFCERWIPCQASTSVLCLHYRPETVHCSSKDAYTSEITFLLLQPWLALDIQLQAECSTRHQPPFKVNSRNLHYFLWNKIHIVLVQKDDFYYLELDQLKVVLKFHCCELLMATIRNNRRATRHFVRGGARGKYLAKDCFCPLLNILGGGQDKCVLYN